MRLNQSIGLFERMKIEKPGVGWPLLGPAKNINLRILYIWFHLFANSQLYINATFKLMMMIVFGFYYMEVKCWPHLEHITSI